MRDTSECVPFGAAVKASFSFSMDAFVQNRRNLVAAVLLGLPVVFAVFYRVIGFVWPGRVGDALETYGQIVSLYLMRQGVPLPAPVPLVALFLASSLVADEVEGKTITYLLTRPLSRVAIFIGKLGAYLFGSAALALPSVVLTFLILSSRAGLSAVGAHSLAMLRDLLVVFLGLAVYGALFALVGILLRRPVLPGLAFLFAWETLASLPGWFPRLTIAAWLRPLIPYAIPVQGIEALLGVPPSLPVGTSIAVLVVLTLLLSFLAARIFSRREYVLGQ